MIAEHPPSSACSSNSASGATTHYSCTKPQSEEKHSQGHLKNVFHEATRKIARMLPHATGSCEADLLSRD